LARTHLFASAVEGDAPAQNLMAVPLGLISPDTSKYGYFYYFVHRENFEPELLDFLISLGGDLNNKDWNGMTAARFARARRKAPKWVVDKLTPKKRRKVNER
jgi:hypothetical protein